MISIPKRNRREGMNLGSGKRSSGGKAFYTLNMASGSSFLTTFISASFGLLKNVSAKLRIMVSSPTYRRPVASADAAIFAIQFPCSLDRQSERRQIPHWQDHPKRTAGR